MIQFIINYLYINLESQKKVIENVIGGLIGPKVNKVFGIELKNILLIFS